MIEIIGAELYQWDTGRSVKVTGINASKVHFANQGDSKAPIMDIVNEEAKIPDYLLQTGKQLCVYAVANGVTIERKTFSVSKRERPEDYIYEEDQRNYIYELITNAENATNEASTAAENAKQATAIATVATENANVATNNANLAADSANKAAIQAAHTAKSLMVVGNAKGETIALNDAIDQLFVGCKIFGKTTQDGTPTPDAPVELVSVGDGGTISTKVFGKNIIDPVMASGTVNGVTITNNKDGSFTLNGTATKNTSFRIDQSTTNGEDKLKSYKGRFYISLRDSSGTKNPQGLTLYLMQSETYKAILSSSTNPTADIETSKAFIYIEVAQGKTFSSLVVYPQLECGSEMTSWEMPINQSVDVTLANGLPGIPVKSGGNYTDANGQQWICDEIDLARGVYVQRVKQVVLKGTESFSASWTEFNSCVAFNYSALDKLYTDPTTWADVMCNILPRITGPNYTNADNIFGVGGLAGSITFKILKTDIGTSAKTNAEALGDWRSYLAEKYAAGMPVVFVYAIKPIETPLSEEELAAYASLHTYRGNTTVFNDAGAYMELEYVMDAKKYIDSKIASAILPATVE